MVIVLDVFSKPRKNSKTKITLRNNELFIRFLLEL